MLAIKFWIFELNFSTLFSLLFGIAIGLAIFAIIYLTMVLATLKNKKYVVLTHVKDVDDTLVKEMIKESQDMFKDKNLKGESGNIGYCKELCVSLVQNISRKFFPESKYPLYELSVDEVLMLSVYVSNRLDEILDHRGLRIFRRVKISTMISLGDVKKNIEDNPLIKATKKYKVGEALKSAKNVINIVNPIYWVRKFVVNKVMDVVIKKLCLIIIGVVGEETYKIYSKSVFNKDVSIDSGIDDLVNDIDIEIAQSKDNGDFTDEEISLMDEEAKKEKLETIKPILKQELDNEINNRKKTNVFTRLFSKK